MRPPALERARAVFDAADCFVTGEKGAVRKADGGVNTLRAAVVDYGGGVMANAVVMRVLGMRIMQDICRRGGRLT